MILEAAPFQAGHREPYDKKDIKTHKPAYSRYPDRFFSYRVYFRLINRSDFPFKACMITMDVPKTWMQPTSPGDGKWEPYINNDLQMIGQPIFMSVTEERWQLTCRLIREWHPDDSRIFYLRMVPDSSRRPDDMKISISCSNADGWEDSIPVEIDRLLAEPAVQA